MSESQEHPAPVKSEIPSLATSEVGKPNKDKSLQEPKKRISKKQLAQRLIASAVIAANIGIPADHVSKGSLAEEPRGVTRELSLQDLEKRAEQLYQIQIVSPDEFAEVDIGGKKVKPEKWTKEEITDLMRVLDKLPPHFYVPSADDIRVELGGAGWGGYTEKELQRLKEGHAIARIQERFGKDFRISKEELRKAVEQKYFEKRVEGAFPVDFIIPNVIPLNLRPEGVVDVYNAQCYCGTTDADPKVLLSHNYSFSTIVHELTHRVSRPEDYKFISDLLEVPDDTNFQHFVHKSASHVRESDLKDAGFDDAWSVTAKFNYGTTNANEFISVASESYIDGNEKFLKKYSIFIGEEKAAMFYTHMRDNIFKGTEYKDYQKVIK